MCVLLILLCGIMITLGKAGRGQRRMFTMNPDFWEAIGNVAQMVYYLVVLVLVFRVARLRHRIERLEQKAREDALAEN